MKIDISPDVHKALSIMANLQGRTIKDLADEILSSAIGCEVWDLVQKYEGVKVPKAKSANVQSGYVTQPPPKEVESHITTVGGRKEKRRKSPLPPLLDDPSRKSELVRMAKSESMTQAEMGEALGGYDKGVVSRAIQKLKEAGEI
jgi:hypothetical protein